MAALVKPTTEHAGISTFVAVGELNPPEVLAAYHEFMEQGATRLVLWDLTAAAMATVTNEELRELAKHLAEVGEDRHSHGKTAIVCGLHVTFGMARIVATMLSIEGFPGKVGVFWDLDTAKAWLTDEADLP